MDWTVYVCVCMCVCLSSPDSHSRSLEDPPCRPDIRFCVEQKYQTLVLTRPDRWMESLEAQAEGSTGGEGVWTLGVAASVPWRQQALCGKILSCGSSHPVPFPRVSANFQTCLTHQFSKLVGIFPTTSFLPKLPRFCWQLLGSDLQVVPVT